MIDYEFLRIAAPIVTLLVAVFFIWGLRTALLQKEVHKAALEKLPNLEGSSDVNESKKTFSDMLKEIEKIRAELSILYQVKDELDDVQILKSRVEKLELSSFAINLNDWALPQAPLSPKNIDALLADSSVDDLLESWLRATNPRDSMTPAQTDVIFSYQPVNSRKNEVSDLRLEYAGGRNMPVLSN